MSYYNNNNNNIITNIAMDQTNSKEVIDASDSDDMDTQSQSAIEFINNYMTENNKTKEDILIDKEFLESVSANFPNISFDQATNVDIHCFGDYGELWRAAYKYPNVGDKINIPLTDNTFAEAKVHKTFIFTIDYKPI